MGELSYVFKQDLLDFIDADALTELTGGRQAIGDNPAVAGTDKVWEDYAPKAIEKVKGYSRHWYDMDTEMRPYQEYANDEAFTVGQRVASVAVSEVRTLYICIQDAPAGTAVTDTDFFTPTDDRNPIILENTVIFIIYNTHRRKNPRQIPEQRQIDYDNATDTMKEVQKGRITLEIAEREDVEGDDPGHEISYGNFEGDTLDVY